MAFSPMPPLALRQRQRDAFFRMLDSVGGPAVSNGLDSDLGGDAAGGSGGNDTYKVLVLDRPCRDVVSPLIRVADLRKHGVTLHLALEADRQAIPEVAALYFVSPTDSVVRRLGKDLSSSLYASWHLHFCSPLPRPGLEALAGEAVRCEGGVARVARVCDQCLGFVTLEQRLFSLGLPRAFVQLNDPQANDKDIEALIGDVVTGLFCVCATLAVVPLIRCPRGGAAQSVAQQLDARLRDHLAQRTGLLTPSPDGMASAAGPAVRPVLVLLDRTFDIATSVQHAWTYQPLCADLLGLRLNRVTVSSSGPASGGAAAGGGPAGAKKSYDVDPEADPFWAAHAGSQFPKVAEEVEAELQKYKSAVAAVNRATEAAASAGDRLDSSGAADAHLMSAVSSLPELTERKKLIDKHTGMATALLGAIKTRTLDAFCLTEEDILSGRGDKAAVAALLSGPKGSPEDRVRLAIIATLAAESAPSQADADATDASLRAGGADVAALAYVRSLRAFNLTGSSGTSAASGGMGTSGGVSAGVAALGGGASQSNLLDWADRALGQGLNAVAKGVNRLLAAGRTLPVARIVEAVLEGRPGSEADDFLVFDPKSPRPGPMPGSSLTQMQAPQTQQGGSGAAAAVRRDAIVFVVGGGSYVEHRALQELMTAKQTSPGAGARTIVYGSTDMLSGSEFTTQLAELGRRMGGGP